MFRIYDNDNLAIMYNTVDTISSSTLTNDVWYMVTAVIDKSNNTQQLYINGVADGSAGNISSQTINITTPMRIGARSYASPAYYFNGQIDEVMIINRALSESEIKGIYYGSSPVFNNSIGDKSSALIASYNMLPDAYLYEDLTSVSDYTIQEGDYLEYDIYWTSDSDYIAVDYTTNSSGSLRSTNAPDENGLSCHPTTDISSYAYNKWYHRKIALPSEHWGDYIKNYTVACRYDGTAIKTGFVDNIVITNDEGTIHKLIYSSGAEFTHNPFIVSGATLNIFETVPIPVTNNHVTEIGFNAVLSQSSDLVINYNNDKIVLDVSSNELNHIKGVGWGTDISIYEMSTKLGDYVAEVTTDTYSSDIDQYYMFGNTVTGYVDSTWDVVGMNFPDIDQGKIFVCEVYVSVDPEQLTDDGNFNLLLELQGNGGTNSFDCSQQGSHEEGQWIVTNSLKGRNGNKYILNNEWNTVMGYLANPETSSVDGLGIGLTNFPSNYKGEVTVSVRSVRISDSFTGLSDTNLFLNDGLLGNTSDGEEVAFYQKDSTYVLETIAGGTYSSDASIKVPMGDYQVTPYTRLAFDYRINTDLTSAAGWACGIEIPYGTGNSSKGIALGRGDRVGDNTGTMTGYANPTWDEEYNTTYYVNKWNSVDFNLVEIEGSIDDINNELVLWLDRGYGGGSPDIDTYGRLSLWVRNIVLYEDLPNRSQQLKRQMGEELQTGSNTVYLNQWLASPMYPMFDTTDKNKLPQSYLIKNASFERFLEYYSHENPESWNVNTTYYPHISHEDPHSGNNCLVTESSDYDADQTISTYNTGDHYAKIKKLLASFWYRDSDSSAGMKIGFYDYSTQVGSDTFIPATGGMGHSTDWLYKQKVITPPSGDWNKIRVDLLKPSSGYTYYDDVRLELSGYNSDTTYPNGNMQRLRGFDPENVTDLTFLDGWYEITNVSNNYIASIDTSASTEDDYDTYYQFFYTEVWIDEKNYESSADPLGENWTIKTYHMSNSNDHQYVIWINDYFVGTQQPNYETDVSWYIPDGLIHPGTNKILIEQIRNSSDDGHKFKVMLYKQSDYNTLTIRTMRPYSSNTRMPVILNDIEWETEDITRESKGLDHRRLIDLPMTERSQDYLVDWSYNENNIVRTGTSYQDGFQYFDGGTDRVSFEINDNTGGVGSSPYDYSWDFTQDDGFSLGCWFKTNGPVSTYNAMITLRDNTCHQDQTMIRLWLNSSGDLHWYFRNYSDSNSNGTITGSNLDDSEWHHAMLVKEPETSNKTRVYIDGELVASSDNPTGTYYYDAHHIDIGIDQYPHATYRYPFKGYIRDVKSYNYDLSATEVEQLVLGNYDHSIDLEDNSAILRDALVTNFISVGVPALICNSTRTYWYMLAELEMFDSSWIFSNDLTVWHPFSSVITTTDALPSFMWSGGDFSNLENYLEAGGKLIWTGGAIPFSMNVTDRGVSPDGIHSSAGYDYEGAKGHQYIFDISQIEPVNFNIRDDFESGFFIEDNDYREDSWADQGDYCVDEDNAPKSDVSNNLRYINYEPYMMGNPSWYQLPHTGYESHMVMARSVYNTKNYYYHNGLVEIDDWYTVYNVDGETGSDSRINISDSPTYMTVDDDHLEDYAISPLDAGLWMKPYLADDQGTIDVDHDYYAIYDEEGQGEDPDHEIAYWYNHERWNVGTGSIQAGSNGKGIVSVLPMFKWDDQLHGLHNDHGAPSDDYGAYMDRGCGSISNSPTTREMARSNIALVFGAMAVEMFLDNVSMNVCSDNDNHGINILNFDNSYDENGMRPIAVGRSHNDYDGMAEEESSYPIYRGSWFKYYWLERVNGSTSFKTASETIYGYNSDEVTQSGHKIYNLVGERDYLTTIVNVDESVYGDSDKQPYGSSKENNQILYLRKIEPHADIDSDFMWTFTSGQQVMGMSYQMASGLEYGGVARDEGYGDHTDGLYLGIGEDGSGDEYTQVHDIIAHEFGNTLYSPTMSDYNKELDGYSFDDDDHEFVLRNNNINDFEYAQEDPDTETYCTDPENLRYFTTLADTAGETPVTFTGAGNAFGDSDLLDDLTDEVYKPTYVVNTVGPSWTSEYCDEEDGILVWEDATGTSTQIRNEMYVTMNTTNIDSVIVYPGCYSSNDDVFAPYQIELKFYDSDDLLKWSRTGEFGFPFKKYDRGYTGGEGDNERGHADDEYYYSQPLVIELPEEIKKESITRLVITFLSMYSPGEVFLSNNFGITELEVYSTSDAPEVWSAFKVEGISRMSDIDEIQGDGKALDNGDDVYIYGTKWNRDSYPRQMGSLPIALVCTNNDKSNPNRRWNFGYSVPIIVRSDLPNDKSFNMKSDLDAAMFWTMTFIILTLGLAIAVGVMTAGAGTWLMGLGSAIMLKGCLALGMAAYLIGVGVAFIGYAAVAVLLAQVGLIVGVMYYNIIGHIFNIDSIKNLSVPYVERFIRKYIYIVFGPLGGGLWDRTYDWEITCARFTLSCVHKNIAENSMPWSEEYGFT